MDNLRPEETADQSVTYPSGETLGGNVNLRNSECTGKSPQRYDPGFGSDIEWKSDTVASIVYMIQSGYLNRNVDTDYILLLMVDLDADYCMNAP